MSQPNPDRGKPDAAKKDHIQEELDEALADSFPASDPVSIVTSQREEAWESGEEEKLRKK